MARESKEEALRRFQQQFSDPVWSDLVDIGMDKVSCLICNRNGGRSESIWIVDHDKYDRAEDDRGDSPAHGRKITQLQRRALRKATELFTKHLQCVHQEVFNQVSGLPQDSERSEKSISTDTESTNPFHKIDDSEAKSSHPAKKMRTDEQQDNIADGDVHLSTPQARKSSGKRRRREFGGIGPWELLEEVKDSVRKIGGVEQQLLTLEKKLQQEVEARMGAEKQLSTITEALNENRVVAGILEGERDEARREVTRLGEQVRISNTAKTHEIALREAAEAKAIAVEERARKDRILAVEEQARGERETAKAKSLEAKAKRERVLREAAEATIQAMEEKVRSLEAARTHERGLREAAEARILAVEEQAREEREAAKAASLEATEKRERVLREAAEALIQAMEEKVRSLKAARTHERGLREAAEARILAVEEQAREEREAAAFTFRSLEAAEKGERALREAAEVKALVMEKRVSFLEAELKREVALQEAWAAWATTDVEVDFTTEEEFQATKGLRNEARKARDKEVEMSRKEEEAELAKKKEEAELAQKKEDVKKRKKEVAKAKREADRLKRLASQQKERARAAERREKACQEKAMREKKRQEDEARREREEQEQEEERREKARREEKKREEQERAKREAMQEEEERVRREEKARHDKEWEERRKKEWESRKADLTREEQERVRREAIQIYRQLMVLKKQELEISREDMERAREEMARRAREDMERAREEMARAREEMARQEKARQEKERREREEQEKARREARDRQEESRKEGRRTWVHRLKDMVDFRWPMSMGERTKEDFAPIWKDFRLTGHPDKLTGTAEEIEIKAEQFKEFCAWFTDKRNDPNLYSHLRAYINTCTTCCPRDSHRSKCYFKPNKDPTGWVGEDYTSQT